MGRAKKKEKKMRHGREVDLWLLELLFAVNVVFQTTRRKKKKKAGPGPN
jgi:hypothetical protein